MQFFVQFFIVQSVFSELNQQNGITLEIVESALVDWVTPVSRRKSQVKGYEAKLKGGGGQTEGLKGNKILDKYGNEINFTFIAVLYIFCISFCTSFPL